jgi:hypothetical protein
MQVISRAFAVERIGSRHIKMAIHPEESEMRDRKSGSNRYSRRDFMRSGLAVAGGLALPAGFSSRAFAAVQPPIGTGPAGSQGD